MPQTTHQIDVWTGEFGREYTDRNTRSNEEMNEKYRSRLGKTRTDMNRGFLDGLDRDIRILEVGCNIGLQSEELQKEGFTNLYAVELQWYAKQIAQNRLEKFNVVQSSGFDIPFRSGYFDLVFTSGVLIHIAPENMKAIMSEIYRCSRKYIWGLEWWAPEWEEVTYRGHDALLWKTDFSRRFQTWFPDLRLVKEEKFPNIGTDNIDVMYLLEKPAADIN